MLILTMVIARKATNDLTGETILNIYIFLFKPYLKPSTKKTFYFCKCLFSNLFFIQALTIEDNCQQIWWCQKNEGINKRHS